MKLKIRILIQRFKQSRFLLGLVCLVIGITGTFIFIEGGNYYRYAVTGYSYAMEAVASEGGLTKEDLGRDTASESHQPDEDTETSSDESIEGLITKTFGSDGNIALAIAKAESNLKHDAINVNTNGTLDVGVFQINDVHGYSVEDRLDVKKNIEIAKKIYDESGWSSWASYNNNSFKKFL